MNRSEDGAKTIKSIFSYSIANIISLVISLISVPIITRIISVADLGIATSFTTLQNILTIIWVFAINIAVDRMLLDVKNKEYEFLSSIYLCSSLFAILLSIIYVIFHDFLNQLVGFNLNMMLLMFSFIILINGCTLLVAYWNFKNKYKFTFLYNLFASPVSQICSLLLAYIFSSNKYLGRILGLNFFNACFGLGCGIYILVKGKCSFKVKYIYNSLKISIPMIPHLLSQVLLTSCDLLMIKNMVGSVEAGVYSMAYTISNILYTVLIQLFTPWSPWFYRRMDNNEVDTINSNSKILMIFSFFLCIGLFTEAPEMIKFLLSTDYLDAIYIVQPICIGIFFQIMYKFFYDVEYFYKKNKQIAVFSAIVAFLNIMLNYFGIKYFGYQAAAYSTLISYLLLLILHYYGMKSIEKRNLFDIKFLLFISIVLFLIGCINIMFVNNFIFRYFILIFVAILIFIKYNSFIRRLFEIFLLKREDNIGGKLK